MKTVLITGGSRGIGKATVNHFLANNWSVITTSTSGEIDYSHPNLYSLKFELGQEDSEDSFVNYFQEKEIGIDCLINNAWWSVGRVDEKPVDTQLLEKVIKINLIGTINLTQKLLLSMNKDAVIVNIASEYGSLTEDWGFVAPSYRIAKAGLNMFTRNYYKLDDVVAKDIKVYSFDPGWVKTDMGGPNAPRQPEEPATELFDLVNSNLPSGEFYRGLTKRDW
jgi:NAD(P)-dependent dehydrogenase (short-subunit alcohol dehydrogenase family)